MHTHTSRHVFFEVSRLISGNYLFCQVDQRASGQAPGCEFIVSPTLKTEEEPMRKLTLRLSLVTSCSRGEDMNTIVCRCAAVP